MSEIVDFAKAREENTPHNSGEAQCVHCGHAWIAVVPVGVDSFQCPSCGIWKGIFSGLCVQQNTQHWQCRCGSFYFSVSLNAIYCVKCGQEQAFPK